MIFNPINCYKQVKQTLKWPSSDILSKKYKPRSNELQCTLNAVTCITIMIVTGNTCVDGLKL